MSQRIYEIIRPDMIFNKKTYPLIKPAHGPNENFDRDVCKSGLKKFIRRLMPWDDPDIQGELQYLFVWELYPGFRGQFGFSNDDDPDDDFWLSYDQDNVTGAELARSVNPASR